MPVVALVAPLGYAVFRGAVGDDAAAADFGRALIWPGALIYVVAFFAVWAGWTLELE